MFGRRRKPLLIRDPEHEAAEREAREQADFDALLVELWGPMEPPERIVLVKPKRRKRTPRNAVVGDWHERMEHESTPG